MKWIDKSDAGRSARGPTIVVMMQVRLGCDNDNLTIGDLCVFLRSEGTDGSLGLQGTKNHQDEKVNPVRKGRALNPPSLLPALGRDRAGRQDW